MAAARAGRAVRHRLALPAERWSAELPCYTFVTRERATESTAPYNCIRSPTLSTLPHLTSAVGRSQPELTLPRSTAAVASRRVQLRPRPARAPARRAPCASPRRVCRRPPHRTSHTHAKRTRTARSISTLRRLTSARSITSARCPGPSTVRGSTLSAAPHHPHAPRAITRPRATSGTTRHLAPPQAARDPRLIISRARAWGALLLCSIAILPPSSSRLIAPAPPHPLIPKPTSPGGSLPPSAATPRG